jgi:hypothetical protein
MSFETETTAALARIEEAGKYMTKQIDEMRPKVEKIDLVEQGLNNHLTSHNRLKNYFLYPVAAGVCIVLVLAMLRMIFHVI